MTAQVLVSTREMDRAEWLLWRRKGIGGSDASAVAGFNPWRTVLEVFYDKINLFPIEIKEQNERMYWGNLLEDIVAKEFTIRTGLKVRKRNAMLQHPEHSFMIGDVDREIIDKKRGKGILEVKTTDAFNRKEWEGDRIPDHYYIQLQHYLAVTGYSYGYFAVLIGGNKFIYREIDRDDEFIESLIKIESEFWQLIENRTPPEVDSSKSATNVLNSLYPRSVKNEIALPSEAKFLVMQYDKALQDENDAKKRKEEAANKLKSMLGENEVGVIGDRKVTWKTSTSSRCDTTALKAEMPDIYKQFLKSSESRRFSVN
ncbi:YqaJ viral recombinase family nuclease [Alicyclobacillus fastidiosus]|uniref:YqaJ viral recombinase family protein n=1 Tax=Alicyclobacillus fastidiosus TaxID=392011 RepID=A0ABV5ALP1_9BACL|nr:YqaJ viral recombinase family protein [Alicyclobacillus fastidiosus]WEH08511.1 YqaJ viral recombinase family protein [Alicyclobacillus fastidiosus]